MCVFGNLLKKNENTYGFIQGNYVNGKKKETEIPKDFFLYCRTETGNGIAYNFMTIILSSRKGYVFPFQNTYHFSFKRV